MKKVTKQNRGFTLLETLVSLGIFTVVATLAISALLVVQSASRRAQATRQLVDNLSFVMEDMSRTVEQGSDYACPDVAAGVCNMYPASGSTPRSGSGATKIQLKDSTGATVTYEIDLNNKRILKTVNGGPAIQITQPNVQIVPPSRFYLTDPGKQPKITAVITAQIGQGTKYSDRLTINAAMEQYITTLPQATP
jgi:prepilin-type N-terminal cleavage/methylation domain-containing protein